MCAINGNAGVSVGHGVVAPFDVLKLDIKLGQIIQLVDLHLRVTVQDDSESRPKGQVVRIDRHAHHLNQVMAVFHCQVRG